MNERLLARILFILGFLAIGLAGWFDIRWSTSGVAARAALVVAFVAAFIGIALDVKHRREDRALRQR